MKPAFERTPQRQWESFHCEVVRGTSYNATWHFHPECQLTLVLKSHGYRLVGDNITALRAGDLVMVGSNLPHVWHQEKTAAKSPGAVHAIVVRFLETFLGKEFLQVPEMEAVKRLFKRARRGLHITGKTRDIVAAKIEQLPQASGLERVARLLSILSTLAASPDLRPIANPGFEPILSTTDHDRVQRVINAIHQHLDEPIDRPALAAEAHLSIGAFSRFFKLRTGKTFPRYLNEVRVGRACTLLVEDEMKITDIAMRCGFNNLANFNRRFQEITGFTPRDYRKKVQRSALEVS